MRVATVIRESVRQGGERIHLACINVCCKCFLALCLSLSAMQS